MLVGDCSTCGPSHMLKVKTSPLQSSSHMLRLSPIDSGPCKQISYNINVFRPLISVKTSMSMKQLYVVNMPHWGFPSFGSKMEEEDGRSLIR